IGLALTAKGALRGARGEAKAMEAAMKVLKAKTKDTPKPLIIARQELDAQIDYAKGKVDKSLQALRAAMKAERALRYTEPPSYPRPVAEVLGRKALDRGKLRIAEEAFRQALDQYPESRRAMTGLDETLHKEGKTVAAGL
ncbi:MAG TPA: hypothetical protein VL285_10955, partial [Bryobacteraceae bacterium]|nr:hypothetical protein [Bryobacteraceae bacterium]